MSPAGDDVAGTGAAAGSGPGRAGGATLADAAARVAALVDSHRTLLVEAGAGSGKTSLLAGRVALLFAAGVPPRSVAAITFTELAAADLAARIRAYVARLLAGDVPSEIAVALPDGLDDVQRAHLEAARASLDDLTSTTIHGFCQDLVRPYPVEAGVDPGARVVDEAAAEALFEEVRDRWLRGRLGDDADPRGAVAAMVGVDLAQALRLVEEVIGLLRTHRDVRPPAGGRVEGALRAFVAAVEAVEAAIGPDAPAAAVPFREAAGALRDHLVPHAGHEAALALAALTLPTTHLQVKRPGGTGYRVYGTRTAWRGADRDRGEARHAEGAAALADLEAAHDRLRQEGAAHALASLLAELADLRRAYAEAKRDAAVLDFDDLIVTAEALLRDHDAVREALAGRYRHVLVDEFQDTDPLQAAILWRLCGDPPPPDPDGRVAPPPPRAGAPAFDWRLRPGALFLVGDPKQSIYRFRGADIDAYLAARDAIARSADGEVLRVSTNFRSVRAILAYANDTFATPLDAPGQSGFTPLEPWRPDAEGPHVVRVSVATEPSLPAVAPTVGARRDLEAARVADAVAALLGRFPVASRDGAACEPGDVALLAPTSSDLWRFERALEERGVPVSTRAGKGFYQRQEVQDLIALARVLGDPRDRLALGAVLRGPLVGCTDEALLDVCERLASRPWPRRRLSLSTDPAAVDDPLVERTLATLQGLRALARRATPYRVLWEAVQRLRVRAVLRARHGRHAERALANLDRFLELARAFDVRGLPAFAAQLRARWTDAERAVEGRPDDAGDAVTLLTVHSSKGLEWPVVVPVNTFCDVPRAAPPVVDRRDRTLHARVLGTPYPALLEAVEREGAAAALERVRLWYVAATRARDLLVLPTPAFAADERWWCGVVDLATSALPELPEPLDDAPRARPPPDPPANEQTAERFAEEEALVRVATRSLDWRSPSRTPSDEEPPIEPPRPRWDEGDRVDADARSVPAGILRGRVLHALMQEVLAGEVADDAVALARRAAVLAGRLGVVPGEAGREGLRADRLAADVRRGLEQAEVAAHRAALVPEVPVYALARPPGSAEGGPAAPAVVTVGVADAVAFAADGSVDLVVDWKSDAEPPPERVERYAGQVRRYLEALGAERGLLVFLASGSAVEVTPGA